MRQTLKFSTVPATPNRAGMRLWNGLSLARGGGRSRAVSGSVQPFATQ